MRRLIYVAVVLIMLSAVIGCAGMSAQQGGGTYDLRSGVGDKPFVGPSSPTSPGMDMHGMSWAARFGA